MTTAVRTLGRARRHRRIRKRVVGMPQRPRLAVFRSHKHLYVQVINDFDQKTLLSGSTTSTSLRQLLGRGGNVVRGGNVDAAQQLGRFIAEEAAKRGIRRVVFDRGGYRYHGRVKALADAARQGGLEL